MKKILTIGIAVFAITMVAVIFYGCGNDDKDLDTTAPTTTTAESTTADTTMPDTLLDMADGSVTDVSNKGNDGAIGDIADDVSEGITDMGRKLAD